LGNQQTVIERLGFSFLRVLTTLDNEYEDINQFLAFALDKDLPSLEAFDGLTDQYVAGRFMNRLSHLDSYMEVMETRRSLSIDNEFLSQGVENNSEDDGMESSGENVFEILAG